MDLLWMDTWREIFYGLIDEVEPEDEWDLKVDQSLTPEALPWGWTFWCSHCGCLWSSTQAVILFHVHLDHAETRGWVRMRTFRQQCHQCWVWAEPVFSQERAGWILLDLVASIWPKCYGEDIVHPCLQEAVAGEHGAPHESKHCEACHLGVHQGMPWGHQGYGRKSSSMGLQEKPGDVAIPWGSRVPVVSVQSPAHC
ncbi:PREDICTED: receptor-transporting protein 2-like [Cariama cristata]|uniref:receptor-transporting protein 2-like n=1 Tax=Cariama cristata TaxID=54380 RepID=UPI00051FF9A3|nr:PREDICTED: receptor-transporting protein 2-like [Cariama cristata]